MTPEAVLQAVDAAMSRPFAWGGCDCVSAACDVFARLWGVDPLAPWRGYHGRAEALRIIRGTGGFDALAEAMAHSAALATGHAPGGLALSLGRQRSMLICIHPGLWAGKTRDGFGITRQAGRGWHLA